MQQNPAVWESLKREFNEPFNQQYIRDQISQSKLLMKRNRLIDAVLELARYARFRDEGRP
jgi:hypothetical protein